MDEYMKSKHVGVSSALEESKETSTLAKMQQQYWATKQAVFKKLGKKEDDCIIASDLELDLKLELYQTIEESFLTLMRVLENYQEKLCILAEEESALGRFLKENSKQDKTRAGKAMNSAGQSLCYSAQQRLTLRIPLVRLYQEVETFQYRAIVDTFHTVEQMEKARTAYRGSLMWMKDASQQLDPDTCKQMEKFRKVQSQVRKAKQRFDRMKLDTLQKVDLLSFSRCNLFSQALTVYQNALLNVSKKISQSSSAVAASTKGYQHYEFSMLKELTETSKKLAEDTSDLKQLPEEDDKDTILFFESEYHDDMEKKELPSDYGESQSLDQSVLSSQDVPSRAKSRKKDSFKPTDNNDMNEQQCSSLLDLAGSCENQSPDFIHENPSSVTECPSDLMLDNEDGSSVVNELSFLDDLVQPAPIKSPAFDQNAPFQWQNVFSSSTVSSAKPCELTEGVPSAKPCFLPSQLLNVTQESKADHVITEGNLDISSALPSSAIGNNENILNKGKSKEKHDMSAWFSLFADLDPLSNPDLVGAKKENIDDRNC